MSEKSSTTNRKYIVMCMRIKGQDQVTWKPFTLERVIKNTKIAKDDPSLAMVGGTCIDSDA